MRLLGILALLSIAPAAGWAVAPAAAPISTAAVGGISESTATISGIYTAERLRDPFARWGAGRSTSKPFTMEDFSIHKLSLRGILKDPSADYALFYDTESGFRFLLRKGKLYDPRNKPLPGIGGSINMKEKMATLTAPEGDVQVFRLGDEEKE
jgi:hypothetical protein